jgi:hypothetical protein
MPCMRRFFADLRDSKFFLIVIEKLGRYNEESSECDCAVVVCHWGCGEGGGLFAERMDHAIQERRDVAGYRESVP